MCQIRCCIINFIIKKNFVLAMSWLRCGKYNENISSFFPSACYFCVRFVQDGFFSSTRNSQKIKMFSEQSSYGYCLQREKRYTHTKKISSHLNCHVNLVGRYDELILIVCLVFMNEVLTDFGASNSYIQIMNEIHRKLETRQ